MADSYRGLTIRIGADTSKLSSALREANGAITAASNQARRLKQALVMDPQNAGAMAKQFSVVGEQAGAVTAKLAILRRAYIETSERTSKYAENGGKTFGELARETDNAALAAENLKSRYTTLEGDLHNVYSRLSAISHNLGSGKTFKVKEGDSTDLKKIAAEYDVLIKKRKELEETSNRTDDQEKELKKLKQRIPVYEELMAKAKELKGVFNEVATAYDDAQTVAELKDLETELANTDAKAMQLFSTLSSGRGSSISDGLQKTNEQMKLFGIAAQEAEAKAAALGKQTNIPVTGLVAAFQQGRALGDQFAATQKQALLLSQTIARYKSAGIDNLAKHTKDAAKAAQEAKRAYDESAMKVSLLEQEIGVAVQRQKELADHAKKDSDEYKGLGQEIERLQVELSEAKTQSEGLRQSFDQSQAVVEYKNLNSQLDQTKAKLAEIAGSGSIGKVTSAALLLAQQVGQYARQGITQVIDSTMTLDSSFADMRKTVNGTEEEFQGLYDAAVEASKVQPISADTILSIEALGGQLGFAEDGLERLSDFADVVGGLDVATNMDWQTAGTYMAQFFNVFQTNKDLVSNYGSALVDLGNHFATTESEISQMSARIASAGTSIGMSEADVMGLATALSSMGVKAEAGGSSISTIMTNIDKSVAMGTEGIARYAKDFGMSVEEYITMLRTVGDDELSDIAKNYEMSAEDFKKATLGAVDGLEEWAKVGGYKTADAFAKAWSGDPIDALTNIFLGLDEATDQEGNLALMLDDLGIKSIRQLDISRRLASNPQLMADAINAANTAWDENVALTNEVAKRNESLSARYETLKNIVTAIKTEFGEGLSPIVDFAIEKLTGFADAMDKMSDESKTSILTIGGALAGLVVFEPVLRGIGGAIGGIATGLLKFAGGALSGIKNLGSLLSMVGGVSDIIPALALFAETALGPLAAALPAIAGVSVGIAGIVYAYQNVIKPAREAKKAQDDFNAAVQETNDFTGALAQGMSTAKEEIVSFDTELAALGKDVGHRAMSVKELTEEINAFNSAASGTIDPVDKSNALLGEYRSVLEKFGGKGRAVGSDLAELEWAVKGINDTLGTNYTAQDILNDKYVSEEGEIDNLCSQIDKLIQKRQEQARVDAAQNMYTKALEEQYELQMNVDFAQEDIDAWDALYEERLASFEKLNDGAYTHEQVMESAARSVSQELGVTREELVSNKDAALQALDAIDRRVEYTKELMGEATTELEGNSSAIADFVGAAFQGWDIDWSDALERNNASLDEFAQKADEAGLTLDDLKSVADDPDVFFSQWVDECEGDIDALIAKIQSYNGTKVQNESIEGEAQRIRDFVDTAFQGWDIDWSDALERSGITVDEFAQKAEDAGIKLGDLKDVADDPSVTFAQWVDECGGDIDELIAKIQEYNDTHIEEKKAEVKVEAANVEENVRKLFGGGTTIETTQTTTAVFEKDDAEAAVQDYKGDVESVPEETNTTAKANTADAEESLTYLITLANSVPSSITININGDASNFNRTLANARASSTVTVDGPRAAGALRYHADGVILNRPTWIGGRDIAGEAGAEAIIPLTNRKYVQPFADTVADGMMSKLGQMTGTTNNYVINGITVAPDSALAKAMDATFDEAKRLNRMGRR